jgi:hypothetical protein
MCEYKERIAREEMEKQEEMHRIADKVIEVVKDLLEDPDSDPENELSCLIDDAVYFSESKFHSSESSEKMTEFFARILVEVEPPRPVSTCKYAFSDDSGAQILLDSSSTYLKCCVPVYFCEILRKNYCQAIAYYLLEYVNLTIAQLLNLAHICAENNDNLVLEQFNRILPFTVRLWLVDHGVVSGHRSFSLIQNERFPMNDEERRYPYRAGEYPPIVCCYFEDYISYTYGTVSSSQEAQNETRVNQLRRE